MDFSHLIRSTNKRVSLVPHQLILHARIKTLTIPVNYETLYFKFIHNTIQNFFFQILLVKHKLII